MIVNGLVTFRAYKKFDYYRAELMQAVEKSSNSTFCFNITNRWIGVRLDFICYSFGIITSSFVIALKGSVDRELLTFSL
jgi:hypothetical protein